MAKSNSPQALSVVAVTHPNDAVLTAAEITKFDDRKFGFNHERTWSSLPYALQGKLSSDAVLDQLKGAHPRIAKSIAALCAYGRVNPVETFKFRDHPDAGIKEVHGLRIGPDVTINAKATCWYIENGKVIIPILQPRSSSLSIFKFSIYHELARRTFCRGDWSDACIEILDLSSSDDEGNVIVNSLRGVDFEAVNEDDLNSFLLTYVQAQKLASETRSAREASGSTRSKKSSSGKVDTFDLFAKGD